VPSFFFEFCSGVLVDLACAVITGRFLMGTVAGERPENCKKVPCEFVGAEKQIALRLRKTNSVG
jgi:hypothetical protein